MTEHSTFYEFCPISLNHDGEEACGDQFKLLRTPTKTILALSDGLGSGIKASILARLTTEIIVTMLREEAPLRDVIETVTGTLPTCKVRGLAYATFAVLQIEHDNGHFHLATFDSPPPILLRKRRHCPLETRTETVSGKSLRLCDGVLENGDFLGLMSDGVPYANPGVYMDQSWGPQEIANFLAKAPPWNWESAEGLVHLVIKETQRRYQGAPGDDATFIGVLAREPRRLVIFTGPPADESQDEVTMKRFSDFRGRRVICGGTTANLAAEYWGEVIQTDESSGRDGIPPVGSLPDADLITEGILTLARTLELLKSSQGSLVRLPQARNGAVLLAREMLQADSIYFLAGATANPAYLNPQLPRGTSIRHSLVTQLVEMLREFNKAVTVEWI